MSRRLLTALLLVVGMLSIHAALTRTALAETIYLPNVLAMSNSSEIEAAAMPQATDVYGPFGCTPGADDCFDMGNAHLVRTPNGVSMKLNTTGLEPGDVYTNWFVIFNAWENCSAPCGEDDIFTDDAPDPVKIVNNQVAVCYAAGNIVGASGNSSFGAHLPLDGECSEFAGINFAPAGLTNLGAEIHIVVRSHGQVIPELVHEQKSTLNGGCPPNDCVDHQFAIFSPE